MPSGGFTTTRGSSARRRTTYWPDNQDRPTIEEISGKGKLQVFHHTCQVAHPDWVMTYRDRPAMLASRQRLLADVVPHGASLVFTHHIFPGWGRIVPTDAGYRWAEA